MNIKVLFIAVRTNLFISIAVTFAGNWFQASYEKKVVIALVKTQWVFSILEGLSLSIGALVKPVFFVLNL